ncbi:MAG: hypothetical protein ACRYG7_14770 [Janthinobacterium lividum]
MLLGCLIEAGLVIWLIITLDYRTWSEPAKKQIKRKQKRQRKWRGQSAHTGVIRFALMMMLLVMGLAFVMIADVITG